MRAGSKHMWFESPLTCKQKVERTQITSASPQGIRRDVSHLCRGSVYAGSEGKGVGVVKNREAAHHLDVHM